MTDILEFIGISELTNAVSNALVPGTHAKRPGNTAEVPTERTLRYYLAEGMIPPPLGKEGVQLRFGRKHLLTVIAIKKLQGLGIASNASIKQILEDKDEGELDEFIKEEVNVKTVVDPSEIARFQQMSAAELEREFGEPVQRVDLTGKNAATEYFEKKLFPPRESTDTSGPLFSRLRLSGPGSLFRKTAVSKPNEVGQLNEWKRYHMAPGIELHVRSDIRLPLPQAEGTSLIEKVKGILGL